MVVVISFCLKAICVVSGKPKDPTQNLRRLSAVDGIKHPDQGARSTISTRRASSGVST